MKLRDEKRTPEAEKKEYMKKMREKRLNQK
jgi:hypothetical protein